MKSIRGQLTARMLLGGALLLGLAGLALSWQVRRALTNEFDAALRATAQALAALTEQKKGKISMEFSGENMPEFERSDGDEFFSIRTTAGREIERSGSLGTARLPLRAGAPGVPEYFETRLSDGRALRCAGLRFVPPEEDDERSQAPRVEAALVVGRNRAGLDRTLGIFDASLLAVGVGALVVLVGLVRWSVRGALTPLDRLGKSVAAMEASSLATRFPVGELPGELRPIAGRLNELFSRLEGAFARERRFTASVSHELRTPLAELRALAEVNLTVPATEAEQMDSWRDILAATRRMESLALRLLELARAENPGHVLQREPLALASAVAEAWRPYAARAAVRGIALDLAIPAEAGVRTDRTLLGVILSNLCANAAEHAPGDSTLHVAAREEGADLSLTFRNPAGDLSEEDASHLFERFWRKDAARSDARHHGLGLSLAAEFSALLGGALTARVDAGGVLEFQLRLPAD